MNIRFYITLIVNSLLQIVLRFFFGYLNGNTWIPITFTTLILSAVFLIANKDLQQKTSHDLIVWRFTQLLNNTKYLCVLLIPFNFIINSQSDFLGNLYDSLGLLVLAVAVLYIYAVSNAPIKI
ncbi:hypothetical protein JEQ21_06745 [Streptococcus sp. 121]|uniref:hypothetical protein n=1 Tax=Streptococcus sp. 121 TaxID=2797637 RepID=UPI0018F0FF56|nr:hypothetical protein [Streptococcus sp. 121]MBJ6746153.1 hypothetical protein [Streptococcus sp. 121]